MPGESVSHNALLQLQEEREREGPRRGLGAQMGAIAYMDSQRAADSYLIPVSLTALTGRYPRSWRSDVSSGVGEGLC